MEMNAELTANVLENLLKHGRYNIPTRNAMENAARLLKTRHWISVKDQLPEKYERVIVLVYGHDVIYRLDGETQEDAIKRVSNMKRTGLAYICEEGWIDADGYPMIVKPSFWMRLPEAPERNIMEGR